jgi:hypothetical protein
MYKGRLGRDQLDRSASITALVQPTKPGARTKWAKRQRSNRQVLN